MSRNSQFDNKTYESTRTYLKNALEHMVAAGSNIRDFSEFTLEKFGDTFLPYLRRFVDDVNKGQIKVKGVTKAARTKLFGVNPSPEAREALIREAAYLRAEKRGFVGGSPEDDWIAAEHEVDERLAQQIGLVEKGHQALSSVTSVIDKELADIKTVVAEWRERRGVTAEKPKKAVSKTSVKRTAAKKSSNSKAEVP